MPREQPACKTRSEHKMMLMVLNQLHTSISQFTTSSPSYRPLPKVTSLAFWLTPSFPPAPYILTSIFPPAATASDTQNLAANAAVVLHFGGDTVVLVVWLCRGDHLQYTPLLCRSTGCRIAGDPFSQKFV